MGGSATIPQPFPLPADRMTDTPFRENLRGILGISACNLLFLINDTLIKVASVELPLSEIIFFRGVFATALILPLVVMTGAHRQSAHLWNWPVFWRTVADVFAAFLYLYALFHIPIANANAILQIVPLMITAAGAVFLGERVGWRRWTAIFVGFVGVLIVVRPGLAGFDVYSLYAVAAMFFITLRDMTTRIMPAGLPALLVALVTGAAVGASGPVFAVVLDQNWVVPSWHAMALIFAAVFFLIGGYLTAVEFMRHGDISVVAPFRYTVILWAMIVGFVVWREVADWPMLLGTAIIILTGVYTFHRERNLARLREEAASGEGL
jgi:drug/metabolite transporter (DMT)-like permease